jgi:hypothetical protein
MLLFVFSFLVCLMVRCYYICYLAYTGELFGTGHGTVEGTALSFAWLSQNAWSLGWESDAEPVQCLMFTTML